MRRAGLKPCPSPAWLVALPFVGLAALLLITSNPGPALVNDTRASAVASWTLGTQGQLALPETWPASHNYWGMEAPDGNVYVNRFPGVAYWAAPAYAVHSIFAGSSVPAHPFLVDLRPAAWMAALTVALAGFIGFLLLRKLVPDPWALTAAGVMTLGTGLWSVAADALWPHGPTALLLLLTLLGWRDRRPVLAGVAAAGCVLVRPHLAVALAVLALYAWRGERHRGDALALLAGLVVGLLALVAYSQAVFGVWTPTAGYDVAGHLGGLVHHGPGQTVGAFFSALMGLERGVLVYTPVVAAALAALAWHRHRLPRWTLASLLAGIAYLVAQVRAVGPLGGEQFFGARISLETLVLAAPALVVAAHRAASRSRVWLAVLVLAGLVSVGIHGYGAMLRSVDPEEVERWRGIEQLVESEFGDLEPHEADLRGGPTD